MKLVVDDDPERMRKRFTFLVDHEELVEYGFGIPHTFFHEGGIASVLVFLFRLYMAGRGSADADLRVQMHEMQTRIPAGEKHLKDGPPGPVPGMLPSGEEDVIDAEFTNEPWDEDQEET